MKLSCQTLLFALILVLKGEVFASSFELKNLISDAVGETSFHIGGILTSKDGFVIPSFKGGYQYDGITHWQEFQASGDTTVLFTFDEQVSPLVGDTLYYKLLAVIGEDTLQLTTHTVCRSFLPERRVVLEEGTGTWCGNCPKGLYAMEYLYEKYPDHFIGISIHNGDPMTLKTYDNALYALGLTEYPCGFVNRYYKCYPLGKDGTPDQGGFETYVVKAMNEPAPASVDITNCRFTSDSIYVTGSIRHALNRPAGCYNISYVLTECNVRGTGPLYRQANEYSGSDLDLGGFEKLPPTIPAEDMVYQEVARSLKPHFRGNVLQTNEVTVNERTEQQYALSIPPGVNSIEQCEITILLLDNQSGEIVNAARASLGTPHLHEAIINNIENQSVLTCFANSPAKGILSWMAPENTLITLYSAEGCAAWKWKAEDSILHYQDLNLHSGYYIVEFNLPGGKVQTKKVYWE